MVRVLRKTSANRNAAFYLTLAASGTPGGTRTPDLLLRRQLLYPAELLAYRVERVTGIEPASPAWKAGALAVVLHPQAL